jgi:hypothetical protein
MRKAINSLALLFFIWLVLDAFSVPEKLVYFILMGELPGTSISLPPTTMLAIMTALIGIIIFESVARHFNVVRRIKTYVYGAINRRERLPLRRFTRI